MIVTTLPITCRQDPPFPIAISPMVAYLLAKYMNWDLVVSTNQIGRCFAGMSKPRVANLAHAYHEHLKKLGIVGDQWNDASENYLSYVTDRIEELHSAGVITNQRAETLRCPCGTVEIVNSLKSNLFARKLFSIEGSTVRCKLCQQTAIKETSECLFSNLGQIEIAETNVFPKEIRREAGQLQKQFSGTKILVSRKRPENPSILISGTRFFLDIDFFWSFFVGYVCSKRRDSELTVVTSNQTLRQAITVSAITKLVTPEIHFNIVVTPMLHFEGVITDLGTFAESGSGKALRYYLCFGLGWNKKESAVPSTTMYWIRQSIAPLEVIHGNKMPPGGIEKFLQTVQSACTGSLICKLRKKKPLTEAELRLYRLLE